MDTEYVLKPEEIGVYTHTRLFNPDFTPDAIRNLRKIHLFPAALPSELSARFPDSSRVLQDNSRELILIDKNRENLMIAIPSSHSRLIRYADMIDRYINDFMPLPQSGLSGSGLQLAVSQYEGASRRTRIHFQNNAYDFTKRVMLQDPADHRSPLREEAKDIEFIITGPLDVLTNTWFNGNANERVIEKKNDEYLDYALVEVGGRKGLALGYVYGDQAGLLLNKFLREIASHYEDNGKKGKVDVYLFGKVGSLDVQHGRHSIAVPNFILSERDVDEEKDKSLIMHPINNSLLFFNGKCDEREFSERYGDALFGANLAVFSVAKQRVLPLLRAKIGYDCSMLEMEIKDTLPVIETTENRPFLDVGFGFIGFVSDRPLEKGDNLAMELDSEEGARKALGILKEKITGK